MGRETGIQWTNHTFNGWRGCTKVSPGCQFCYADAGSKINPGVLGEWGPDGTRVVGTDAYWDEPLAWDRAAADAGERRRVFALSLGDVFESDKTAPRGLVDTKGERLYSHVDINASAIDGSVGSTLDDARARLLRLVLKTPNLDWLLLTKRADNILPSLRRLHGMFGPDDPERAVLWAWLREDRPPPNIWLGVSVENQRRADERIPHLLKVPAAVRFLSVEPLLGPIRLDGLTVPPEKGYTRPFEHDVMRGRKYPPGTVKGWHTPTVDWVIGGFESGPKARPGHPDWARSLRDQCQSAGVPFFWKQNGEWLPISELGEAAYDRFYVSKRKVKPGEDQGALDDIYGRRCTVPTLAIRYDGLAKSPEQPGAWEPVDGHPAYQTFRVGKKSAGRLLDGRTWDQMPGPLPAPALLAHAGEVD